MREVFIACFIASFLGCFLAISLVVARVVQKVMKHFQHMVDSGRLDSILKGDRDE